MTKGHRETYEGDGHVHYLAYGNGFMGVDLCQKLQNFKYVQLTVCQLYLNMSVLKM